MPFESILICQSYQGAPPWSIDEHLMAMGPEWPQKVVYFYVREDVVF